MNTITKKLFALVLALLLVLSLAACEESGGKGNGKGDGSGDRFTPVVNDPKDDPAGYLAMASENMMLELAERYSGSPFAAIAGALDTKGEISLSGSLDIDGSTVDLKNVALQYDSDKKALLMELDVLAEEMELTGGACVNPDFIGVSFPMLFGSDDYYGFKPKNIVEQLKNSPLMDLLDGEVDLDSPEFAQIDELLETLWDSEFIDYDALTKELQKIENKFMKGLDVEYDEETVNVNGEEADGYVFVTHITTKDITDLMDDVCQMVLDMPMWDSLSSIAGQELDMSELEAAFDSALDEIAKVDIDVEATYYVADGKVVSSKVESKDGIEMEITVDYFDGNSISGTVNIDGFELEFVSTVKSTKRSYKHVITLDTKGGDSLLIEIDWDGDELTIEGDNFSGDELSVSCGLTTSKRGFTIEDLNLNGVSFPLTISYSSGKSASVPKNTKNIFELSEEELTELLGGLIGSGDESWDDYYGY